MTNREEIKAKHESYQKELSAEVGNAKEEIGKIARNALIAGALAVTANLLQKAFFKDDEEKRSYKVMNEDSNYLTDEVTEKAIVELLKMASGKLEEYLEEVNNNG